MPTASNDRTYRPVPGSVSSGGTALTSHPSGPRVPASRRTPTVAVIASQDTKAPEVAYVVELLTTAGLGAVTVDVSTSPAHVPTDLPGARRIDREQVTAAGGAPWESLAGRGKHELLEAVARGAQCLLPELWRAGAVDAVLGLGGLQNTTVAAQAVTGLPIGLPKVIVSTVACGRRTFDMVVGTKDVVVIPAVTDLSGLNTISRAVLANAVGAVAGMLHLAGRPIGRAATPGGPAVDGGTTTDGARPAVVGATLMGATNDGVARAADLLREKGAEVMCFHSTGVGGAVMEELIADGTITAAMDLTLHEVVYEYLGGGFGSGDEGRLTAGARAGIPMVVAPGGIDFVCQWAGELFENVADRAMIWHNTQLAHVKLTPGEARDVARIVVGRLNEARGPVELLYPLRGLRTFTAPGQGMYDPAVDGAILEVFRTELRPDIPLVEVDASIVDPSFSELAARRTAALLASAGRAVEAVAV